MTKLAEMLQNLPEEVRQRLQAQIERVYEVHVKAQRAVQAQQAFRKALFDRLQEIDLAAMAGSDYAPTRIVATWTPQEGWTLTLDKVKTGKTGRNGGGNGGGNGGARKKVRVVGNGPLAGEYPSVADALKAFGANGSYLPKLQKVADRYGYTVEVIA